MRQVTATASQATHGWVSLGLTILFTSANLRVFFALPMMEMVPVTVIRSSYKLTYSMQPDTRSRI